ncbi:MAG TPA: Rid family hydrolase [Micromonosporaceae bacterium]|nr:Rid family hydrolase [Micromonosporaceae bacterium]
MSVTRLSSGGPWEDVVGYSRVVAAGPWVLTAGCTATVEGVVTHVGDPYRQTLQAYRIALAAAERAGASLADVVRTRTYLVHADHADAAGRAHAELFAQVRPVSTMVVVAGLIHPDHLVEVELEAFHP